MQLLGFNIIVDENSYVERQGAIILPHRKHGKDMFCGEVKMIGARVEEFEALDELGLLADELIGKQVLFPSHALLEVDEMIKEYCTNTLKIVNPVMIKVGQIQAIDNTPITFEEIEL